MNNNDKQLELPGLAAQLAEQAAAENVGAVLDLDTARFVLDADVSTVHLVNDLGESGSYAVLEIKHCTLTEIQDESAAETTTFVFGSSATLELTTNLLKSVQGYVQDPEQENTDV